FPVVLKPEMGHRGAGFRVIHSVAQAHEYFSQVPAPIVAQRYVEYEREAGIFYFRYPGAARGEIFAVTRKEFPVMVGDGKRALRCALSLGRGAARGPRVQDHRVEWSGFGGDEHLRSGDLTRGRISHALSAVEAGLRDRRDEPRARPSGGIAA